MKPIVSPGGVKRSEDSMRARIIVGLKVVWLTSTILGWLAVVGLVEGVQALTRALHGAALGGRHDDPQPD
jgi:hypothetical protein